MGKVTLLQGPRVLQIMKGEGPKRAQYLRKVLGTIELDALYNWVNNQLSLENNYTNNYVSQTKRQIDMQATNHLYDRTKHVWNSAVGFAGSIGPPEVFKPWTDKESFKPMRQLRPNGCGIF